MAYSYDAGSTTPTYTGLAEIGGIRINDGTFKSSLIGCIDGGPAVRLPLSGLPNAHGSAYGRPYYDGFTFPLNGWIFIPSPDDLPAARDQLRGVLRAQGALQTLTLNARGWTSTRQMSVLVAAAPAFSPRHQFRKVPTLDFTATLVAPDPLQYNAATQQVVTVATGGSGVTTNITNNGDAYAPFTVRFNGAWTNPQLVLNGTFPGAPQQPQVYMGGGYAIAGSHYIDYNTNVATGGPTAVDDTGANVYGNVTTDFFIPNQPAGIPPGTTQWWVGGTPGTGASCTVTFRDAWI